MPKLTFLVTGETHDVPAGTRFLDFCEQNAAPHEFGCTVGSCGTCCLTIETGAEHVDPPSADERETVAMCTDVAGARLGCQLVIRGDLAIRPVER
ncbi:MAG: (2Fe-2S)-binding protein [Planctomycetes bacterium]|nr:(2Fe-2S)-binding protein [Planctomycetota bacterium]